jgi:hypothetical protein
LGFIFPKKEAIITEQKVIAAPPIDKVVVAVVEPEIRSVIECGYSGFLVIMVSRRIA